jgi:hypothetical protein
MTKIRKSISSTKMCIREYTFFNLGWLESGLNLNLQLKVVENQFKQIQLEFFL